MEGVRHIGCWAHAQRKLIDVTKALGKNRKAGAAYKALSYIEKLYKLEKTARDKKFTPQQIYRMRQEETRVILDDFEKWLAKK